MKATTVICMAGAAISLGCCNFTARTVNAREAQPAKNYLVRNGYSQKKIDNLVQSFDIAGFKKKNALQAEAEKVHNQKIATRVFDSLGISPKAQARVIEVVRNLK